MFDNILFENDIPDPELRERAWQTKSLENALIEYRISSEGELFEKCVERRMRESPKAFLGWESEVIREWEEKVDFHGVIEAYTGERLDDGSYHSVTYDVYFTYGKLTSLERSEETHPPPQPRPILEDESPRHTLRVGVLETDLPETIQVVRFEQEGRLHVLRLQFEGYLHAGRDGSEVEIWGTAGSLSLGEATVRSTGRVRHIGGKEIEILASDASRGGILLLVIAPRGYGDGQVEAEV